MSLHSRPLTAHTGGAQVGSQIWAWGVLGVYFLSGITGLAYEILWVRMLTIQFGVSSFGVVMTLATFMIGLGAGSLMGGRWFATVRQPLLVLAVLEGLVALFALLMPWLFSGIDHLLGDLAAAWPLAVWYAIQALMAFLLLFFPSLALGLGFPLVLKALRGTSVTLPLIYGINTAGGAAGALLPLLLLPTLGWTLAMQTVALVGLGVALGLALLARRQSLSQGEQEAMETDPMASRPAWRVLLAYGVIGGAALMLEIGWSRLYGMVLLRTEYVLAIILFVFLVGIGIGSIVARWLSLRLLHHFPWLAALAALFSLWGLPMLAAWAEGAHFQSLPQGLFLQTVALALLTLPLTLVLGAWLPLLARHVAGGTVTGAWLYGANALGAGLGALLCGFVFIPAWGTASTLCLAALLLFVAGMVWVSERRYWSLLPVFLILAWPLIRLPPVSELLPEAHAGSRDLMLYEDAISVTHVVEDHEGQRILLSDLRRMDASSEPTAVEVQKNQGRLALLLHPRPMRVLFLGLGTGITASPVVYFPALEASAVELSAGSIRAARLWFEPVNEGVSMRIAVHHDDARRFLRASEQRYDVIVGDLFHPDLVGRSHLLSVQQFQRGLAHLAAGGLYIQWLALNQFDVPALQTVIRSFQAVFPAVQVYTDGLRLALVGYARSPESGRFDPVERMAGLTASQRKALTGGEGMWTWLGRFWGPLPMPDGPVQDEWAPKLEFSLPILRYGGSLDLGRMLEWLLAQRPTPEAAWRLLGFEGHPHPDFEGAYVATELAMRSWLASIRGRNGEAQRLLRFAYEANPLDRWVGYGLADRLYASLPALDEQTRWQVLQKILEIRPDHVQALREVLRMELAREPESPAVARYRQRLQTLAPFLEVP